MPRAELVAPRLADFLDLDEKSFRSMFTGSPIKRTGRVRFLRNVLIAIGNSGESAAANRVRLCLTDESPLVRGAAIWALAKLCPASEIDRLRREALTTEADVDVLDEWRRTDRITAD